MVRVRSCKIGPSVLLALLLSMANTIIILFYLGPSHFRSEDSFLPVVLSDSSSPKVLSTNVKTSSRAPKPTIQRISVVNQGDSHKIDFPTTMKRSVHSNTTKVDIFTDWNKLSVSKQQENLDHAYDRLKFHRNVVSMIGRSPDKPVDVVIGIPTVKRDTMDYLSSTLQHLVKYLDKNETKQCHIVVFSANFEQTANEHTANFIKTKFAKEVAEGLIEVIKPDITFYSKLTELPVLWKDKPDRVKWRSKQCLDYALLFSYCRTLGRYYLQLEDDVSVSQTYFREMKNFIRARGLTKWSNLQFGTSGFIGMLFRASDLGRLALFVKMYYWVFPVDILFRHYNDIHLYGNNPKDLYRPPLFQHLGRESSLKGQTRKIVKPKNAKQPVNARRYSTARNPSAFVSTNIEVFEANTIDKPYRTSNIGYFWGKAVHLNDYVLLEFMREVTLLGVTIETGSKFAPNDRMAEGKLETTDASKTGNNCNEQGYKLLSSTTSNGKINASSSGIPNVKCVKMTITKLNLDNQKKSRWLLIREIAVWSR